MNAYWQVKIIQESIPSDMEATPLAYALLGFVIIMGVIIIGKMIYDLIKINRC